ncbi:30S ribosomal protein S2 [Candidatus Dependentiae bacterium]|nr:30S ribosomal protein S2 [Candidatus Dependentiae bacterium]
MIDLKKLLDVGIHFGHKTSRWSPKMRPFIWGSRNKVHLIDISKTAFLLERAGSFAKTLAAEGGSFLFVGTKKPAQGLIRKIAGVLAMPFVVHRWIGGTLSNFDQVKKAITRLLHFQDIIKKNQGNYKKKELVMIQKEIERLEKNIGGIINLDYPPAAIIVVDGKKEHAVIKEASRLGIPVIGLIDTNTDPEGVTHVIPGNDDSPKAIEFVLNYLEASIKEGRSQFEQKKQEQKAQQVAKRAAEKAEKSEAA